VKSFVPAIGGLQNGSVEIEREDVAEHLKS
jgi:hypothetical protein